MYIYFIYKSWVKWAIIKVYQKLEEKEQVGRMEIIEVHQLLIDDSRLPVLREKMRHVENVLSLLYTAEGREGD